MNMHRRLFVLLAALFLCAGLIVAGGALIGAFR